MNLDGPDAKTLTRRRREKRADYVVEIPFGEPAVEYTCPECGGEFHATLHVPKDEPTFLNCSDWDCDAFLKFIHKGDGSSQLAGLHRPIDAFSTDTDGGVSR